MRLEDYIKKSIHKYPILHKDRDYQKSRMKVLEHIYLHGLDFSTCKEYLVDPQYRDVDDELVRIPDAPYGQEVYDGPEMDQSYFDTPSYYVCKPMDFDGEVRTIKVEENSYTNFRPSHLSQHATLIHILTQDHNLQQDWIDGGSDVAREALRYYDTPTRFRRDHYFPSPQRLHEILNSFEEVDDVQNLGKIWGYKDGESILSHIVNSWIGFHSRTVKEFDRYLRKFSDPVELPQTPSYQDLYDEIHGYLFAPNGVELFEMIGKSDDSRIQKLIGNYRMPQDQFEKFRDKVTKAVL